MPTRTLLVIAIGLLPGIVVGQGLGGVSRKEANRRESRGRAEVESHTYTDADLRSDSEDSEGTDAVAGDVESGVAAAAPATPGFASDPAGPASPSSAAQETADRLREELDRAAARRKERERKWRERVAAARARLDDARKEHDAVCNPNRIALRGG